MSDLSGATAHGVTSLMDLAPVITILVLCNIVLLYFIKLMMQDAKEERKVVRDALIGNTAVMARLEELIRATVAK